MIVNAKPSGILSLGRTGENQARSIRFDISHWVMDFGPGVVELVHQRSGDPYPYPVVVSQDGNEVTWNITATDTAMVGLGRCELRYYVGETLAKSETWMTKVFPALGPAAETPPDPYQSWVDQVLQAGAEAKEAAEKAENAAVRQPYPNAETGTWWVWDAESGAYTDTGVSYGTGGGGTSDHDKLLGRDKENQHPIRAITGLEDALAGKQPTGSYITEETDPTVPAWAKAETKPSYTAHEVGADPAGTAAGRVSEHNTEATAHSDMRLLIKGLTDRLNALADSDDTTLDQLSEIVAYIKSNRDLIAAITTDKVSVADIVNDLVTNVTNRPLSASQGVALKALIDSLNASDIGAIPAPATATVGQTIRVSAVDENGQPTEWEAVDMAGGMVDSYGNREPDYYYPVSEEISALYISEINGNSFSAQKFACLVEFPAGTGGFYYHALYTIQGSKDKNYCVSNNNAPIFPEDTITTTDSVVFIVVEKLNNQNYLYSYSGQCKNRGQELNGLYGTHVTGIFPNSIEGETSIKSILLKGRPSFGVGVKISIWLD